MVDDRLRSLFIQSLNMSLRHSTSSRDIAEKVGVGGSILSLSNLSYQVSLANQKKILVDDVSASVRAGELLAVMVSRTALLTYG